MRMLFILLFFLILVFSLLFLASARVGNVSTRIIPPEAGPTPIQSGPTPAKSSYQNPFMLTNDQIVYPIVLLGNCTDTKDCYAYCAIPRNTPACWSYGTYVLNKQVLAAATSSGQIEKKFSSCEQEQSCKSYCEKHPNECPGFAPTSGSGTFPSVYLGPKGCRTQEECQQYCEAHPSECPGFQNKESTAP